MLVKGHPFFTESPFCMKHIIDIDVRGENEACQYVVGLKMADCFGCQSVRVE